LGESAAGEAGLGTPGGYYSRRLSGERLRRCYEVAPPRVRQYLEAEISFVLSRIAPEDEVLELGCGYGRVARRLAAVAGRVVGIDTAPESLTLARALAHPGIACEYLEMDAADLGFPDGSFDAVVCVQNGLSAFGVDPLRVVREALRVTRQGGKALFSSYAPSFWKHRLDWFRLQAREGLVGEIDEARTGGGVIVCRDGFRATTLREEDLAALARALGAEARTAEVDGSSMFCEMAPPRRGS
jgi:2-polyprenyl-6-hydroxyphenyl methylase/3-demethylubiquinone-9 3-methyltransferase